MQTQTVHVGEATVTVRRETRRAALNRARYLSALEAIHPELKQMTPTWFIDERDRVAREVMGNAFTFCATLSQVVGAENAPVRLPQSEKDVLSADDVRAAWQHFLDDTTDFWDEVMDACMAFNAPITSEVELPESALTEEQKADPN